MRMFHYRRFDNSGTLSMARNRPLLQNETGVLVIADTNDIPAGDRIIIDAVEVSGVLPTQAAQNAAELLLSVGEVDDIWFRQDTGVFLTVVDDNGAIKFLESDTPDAPLIDFGGGDPDPDPDPEPGDGLTPTGTVVTYDSSTDADRFNFVGVWTESGNGNANAGNTKYSNGQDQYVVFAFLGTRLKLFGFHRPINLVRSVDGGAGVAFVGQANSGSVTGQIDDTGDLPFGFHTYKLTAGGAGLFVDTVQVTQ